MTAELTSVLVGANGRRADQHAEAYRRVRRAELVGVSARTPGTASTFAGRWGVPAAFEDYREMLEVIRPDIVHLNTPPTARRSLLQDCADAGVAGVIMEKPVGNDVDDLIWLREFERTSAMRVVVNHQLHYHPRRQRLAELIKSGGIGRLRIIEGSARHTIAYQGTHVLEGVHDWAGRRPRSVTALVSGRAALEDDGRGHISPEQVSGLLDFGDGLLGIFRSGDAVAPSLDDPRARERHQHKRLVAWGEEGFAEWTMWGWRTRRGEVEESGDHAYEEEDLLGQAALVDDLVSWLTANRTPAVALSHALDEFSVLLALYTSALERRPVELPHQLSARLIPRLRETL